MTRSGSNFEPSFEWEDPPEDHGPSNGVWPRRLRPLQANPNKWALVGLHTDQQGAQRVAHQIEIGGYSGLVEGQYEATYGRHPSLPDRWGVWARFPAGEDGDHA
jgi:hypothetical protein